MNLQLEQLVLLQAQDLEMRKLRLELEAAPGRVARAEAAQAQAEAERSGAEKGLAREEALRRAQELEIKGLRAKLDRLRRQMETAASAAQITALEHEISFAGNAISSLEDQELESLERTDALIAEKLKAEQAFAGAVAAVARVRTEAAVVAERNHTAITALEEERAAQRAALDDRWLAVYDRVARARGTGVAEVAEGQCTACQMKLRPQRWNDLTGREHAAEIFTCESCGRVLFRDPRRDAPGAWTAGDRLAAARGGEDSRR